MILTGDQKEILEKLMNDESYSQQMGQARFGILDLLEFLSLEISFSDFLEMSKIIKVIVVKVISCQ